MARRPPPGAPSLARGTSTLMADIHRHDAQRELSALHRGYHHEKHPYLDVDLVLAGLDDAARRSAVLDVRAAEAGALRRNPTTSFSEAIASFRRR